MFKVPIDKIIPVTSARAKISSLVKKINDTGGMYVLTRGGKPAAILASVEMFERTQKELDEAALQKQVENSQADKRSSKENTHQKHNIDEHIQKSQEDKSIVQSDVSDDDQVILEKNHLKEDDNYFKNNQTSSDIDIDEQPVKISIK